jgi:Tfp pilus assembly protein PilF
MTTISTLLSTEVSDLTFLCGAGVSYDAPTSLPTVATFYRTVLATCGASSGIEAEILRRMREPAPPRFEALVEEIATLADPSFVIGRVFDTRTFNEVHAALAALVERGTTVITTNFDTAIENASCAAGAPITVVTFSGDDIERAPIESRVLVKPHGTVGATGSTPLVISIAALSQTNGGFVQFPHWRDYLFRLINARTLVVVGYSGSDDFDITPLLLDAAPKQVLWVLHDSNVDDAVEIALDEAPPHIVRFAARIPLVAFRGSTRFVSSFARSLGDTIGTGPEDRKPYTVAQYLAERFSTATGRRELLNVLLLHHAQYERVLEADASLSSEVAVQRLKALFRLGRYDDVDREARLFDAAAASLAQRVAALYYESSAHSFAGRTEDALRTAENAVDIARRLGGVKELEALNQLGGVYCQTRRYGEARLVFQEALSLQDTVRNVSSEARSLWGLATVAAIAGDLTGALDYFLRARTVFDALGDDANTAWCDYNCADTAWSLRRLDDARMFLARAKERFQALGTPAGQLYAMWLDAKLSYFEKNFMIAHTILRAMQPLLLQERGFLWILDYALLYNCAAYRTGQPSERFASSGLRETLAALDAANTGLLTNLVTSWNDAAIQRAEHFIFDAA